MRNDLNNDAFGTKAKYNDIFADFVKDNLKEASLIAVSDNGMITAVTALFDKLVNCRKFDFSDKAGIFTDYTNQNPNDRRNYSGNVLDALKDCLKNEKL